MKWDLRIVAAALIYRDYSLAHQGLLEVSSDPSATPGSEMQRQATRHHEKSPHEFMSQALWIKAAVSPFHAILGSSLSPST